MGLAVNEHMYKMGFQAQGHLYTTPMMSLREYAKNQGGNIFGHYYGFLCFRQLVCIICCVTLENSDQANEFLDQMPPSTPWMKTSEKLSEVALELLYRAVTIKDMRTLFKLLGFAPVHGPIVFYRGTCDQGMTKDDVRFLIDVLWKSRKSIIKLCSKGLLHGLPVLLFLFHQMAHLNEDLSTFERPWTKLQVLILRCYLSTSKDSDRQYLHQVSQ
ncbi:hypothetical protein B0J17DRAFT_294162 [Rhizoctonia solani]|nr:hypothetical protein B0J17DRAFT_294162 [Rhizoctonia solani]